MANMIFNSYRLNIDNPQHARVNEILNNLDKNVCGSKNQFVIDAIEFYVENFGKEKFIQQENKPCEYVKVEDIEKIKEELIEVAMTEARREVIRELGIAVSGRVTVDSSILETSVKPPDEEDDEVMSGLAASWMSEVVSSKL